VAILAGAFFLFRALQAMRTPATASPASGAAPSASKGAAAEAPADPYVSRFEEEVKKRN